MKRAASLRLEVLKLRRSRSLLLVFVVAFALFPLILLGGKTAERDALRMIAHNTHMLRFPEKFCYTGGRCLDQIFRERPSVREGYVRQVRYGKESLRSARATTAPAGMTGVVFAAMGSGPGAAAGLLLGAHLVGIELSSRTLGLMFSRRPRRWRTVVAKTVVGWTAFAVMTLALAAAVGLLALAFGSSGADPRVLALPPLAYQVAVPLVTGAVFVAIGASVALIARTAMAPLPVIIGWSAIEFALARLPGIGEAVGPWTLTGQMWSLGEGFHERVSNSVGQYWFWPPIVRNPHAWILAAAALSAFAGTAVLIAARRARTDERY